MAKKKELEKCKQRECVYVATSRSEKEWVPVLRCGDGEDIADAGPGAQGNAETGHGTPPRRERQRGFKVLVHNGRVVCENSVGTLAASTKG